MDPVHAGMDSVHADLEYEQVDIMDPVYVAIYHGQIYMRPGQVGQDSKHVYMTGCYMYVQWRGTYRHWSGRYGKWVICSPCAGHMDPE